MILREASNALRAQRAGKEVMQEHKDIHTEHRGPPKGEQLLLDTLAFNSIKVQPQLKNRFGKHVVLTGHSFPPAAAPQKEGAICPQKHIPGGSVITAAACGHHHQVTWTKWAQPATAGVGQYSLLQRNVPDCMRPHRFKYSLSQCKSQAQALALGPHRIPSAAEFARAPGELVWGDDPGQKQHLTGAGGHMCCVSQNTLG